MVIKHTNGKSIVNLVDYNDASGEDNVQSIVVNESQASDIVCKIFDLKEQWQEKNKEGYMLSWILDTIEQEFDIEYYPNEILDITLY